MFNRDDFEESFSQARTIVDIVRALAQGELETARKPQASLYAFLAEELDARFERIQVEIEDWEAPPIDADPPAMPPLTEAEIAASVRIAEELRQAIPLLHQRNLDRAVLLAKQAAEGTGPLVEHFAELGRRFKPEKPEEVSLDDAASAEGGRS